MNISEFEHQLFERGADGMMGVDERGILRFWNDGCVHIFGFSTQEAVGQSLDLIIPESLRAGHWNGFEQTIKNGSTRRHPRQLLSVPAIHKDQRRISVEFSIILLQGKAGAPCGMGAIVRDVTTQFEETKALRRRLTALEHPFKT